MNARVGIHSSCYIALGVLLLILNVPICLIILANKQLRITFAVLAALFAASALAGLCAVTKGISWLQDVDESGLSFSTVDSVCCLKKPSVLLDLFTFESVALLLAANSFDRLLVVYMPISYFKHAKYIVIVQISMAVLALVSLELFTVIDVVVDEHRITPTSCRLSDFLPPLSYSVVIFFRLFNSILSILLMAFVLFKFEQHISKSMDLRRTSNVDYYITKQTNFTKAMLFSCCFTFLLDTIPNSAMVYAYLVNSEVYHEMVFYAKTACMFNAANMVIVVMRTPTEIRERFLYYLHKWVPLKNHIVVVPARQRALCTRNFATLIPSD